jgi:hypothetical protein
MIGRAAIGSIAWSKQIAGADFISISAEIAGNGGPRKKGGHT